jgi:hypothetical protein
MLETFKMEAVDDGTPFEEYTLKLGELRKLADNAAFIATREVKGEALTEDDYRTIKAMSNAFDSKLLLPSSMGSERWRDLRMATITEISVSSDGNTSLMAATGAPLRLFVYLNDPSGGPRIAIGYVYSYYEFQEDKSNPTTLEKWQNLAYDQDKTKDLNALRPKWMLD